MRSHGFVERVFSTNLEGQLLVHVRHLEPGKFAMFDIILELMTTCHPDITWR